MASVIVWPGSFHQRRRASGGSRPRAAKPSCNGQVNGSAIVIASVTVTHEAQTIILILWSSMAVHGSGAAVAAMFTIEQNASAVVRTVNRRLPRLSDVTSDT